MKRELHGTIITQPEWKKVPNDPALQEWWVRFGREADMDDLNRWMIDPDHIDGLIEEAQRLAWIDALEWLQKHASGGGDWRRKIVQKIGELSERP